MVILYVFLLMRNHKLIFFFQTIFQYEVKIGFYLLLQSRKIRRTHFITTCAYKYYEELLW